MKTRSLKKNKVNVITLGCSKNIYDSEVLMGQLRANDFTVSHEDDNSDAPVVIINTCGFIDNAKQESINTILQWAEAKEKGLVEKVYVTGCLSERYMPELKKEIPNIDEYFGTRDLPRLLKTMNADYKQELIGERLLTTPLHYAYFKISEGCDRPCSFCAIPIMRGKHVSIPMERLIEQAKGLARQGVKELILIAQDLTYYGLDIYKKRVLADMLRKLCEVDGITWIRLHYAFPQGFPMDVLDVMAGEQKICKYLDMPLQHAHPKTLYRMKRPSNIDWVHKTLGKMRATIADLSIRTTFLVGYPGETDEEYKALYDFVKEIRFDRVGAFQFSFEPGTTSAPLGDPVPAEVKQERYERLMELQQNISLQVNQSYVGKTLDVLVEGFDNGISIGRSYRDAPEIDGMVFVEGQAKVGDIVPVRIGGAMAYDLTGVLAQPLIKL